MPRRSLQMQLTTRDGAVLAKALGLTLAAIMLPGRRGRLAGLTLAAYLLHRQAVAIEATDRQAREAGERGHARWVELTDRVRAVEALLSSQYVGGLAESSAEWARRAVVARAVADLTGTGDPAQPPPSWRQGTVR